MELPIDQIIIKKRIRKNLGNLSQLMESMKRHGQFNPIVVTDNYELIAGHRRLESAKRLGWSSVEVRVLRGSSDLERIEIEMDENIHRRNLSADELTDGYSKLQKYQNPSFFRLIWNAIVNFFKKIFGKKD